MLVREGLVTRPQLYDALRLQRQNNLLLGTCLLSLGYVDAERLLSTLAKQLAIPALRPGTLGSASTQ
ncbi:MAG: type II secretion system protein GspE, partial [Myxococcota bacterium]